MLIRELPLTEIEIKCLQQLVNSKTLAQIAVGLEMSYSGAYQKMLIWEVKGWIKKIKTYAGKTRYGLNRDFFYPKKKEEIEKEVLNVEKE